MNINSTELEFLQQSNAIEREYSDEALEDAISAWTYSKTLELLTVNSFIEIHRLLMLRLRPDIAGKYRTCTVTIGGEIKKYRGSDLIESLLLDVSNFIIESSKLETVEEKIEACTKAHVMFEKCHPFEDGNGRVGRIIYNWHRLQLGLPLHIIHVGKEQHEYYRWFL